MRFRMFTGLTECTSKVKSKSDLARGARFTFSHAWTDLTVGESISVSGACLTVIRFDAHSFEVDVSPETLRLTTLGSLKIGEAVNLERALAIGERLGGHLVSGHVDGMAEVESVEPVGEMVVLTLILPSELDRYVAKKGSLTVDGVSLTVNESSPSSAQLLLIPHTREVTTLGALAPGARVNIEIDLVARYVESLLEARKPI